MSLHPQVTAFLNQLRAAQPKPTDQCSPAEIRAAVRAGHLYEGDPEAVGDVGDLEMAGPGGPLRIRRYRPLQARNRGALVFYHGGGWVAGDLDTHDALCRAIANESGGQVFAIDYRCAPEHPYPAAVDDAYAAFQWLQDHGEEHQVDRTRIAVGGDSAGGNLAAVVSLIARDRRDTPPCLQALVYPVTDYRFDGASYRDFAEGYGLTTAGMRHLWNFYVGDPALGKQPYASPMRAADHSDLAPAVFVIARHDVLYDDGDRYAAQLAAAGNSVERFVHRDMIHGFIGRLHTFDSARVAVQQIAEKLQDAFAD